MEISDSFRVNRSLDETWKVLLDIERIAPACPARSCRRSKATTTAAW